MARMETVWWALTTLITCGSRVVQGESTKPFMITDIDWTRFGPTASRMLRDNRLRPWRLLNQLDDELRAHLEFAEGDAIASGLTPEEARRTGPKTSPSPVKNWPSSFQVVHQQERPSSSFLF